MNLRAHCFSPKTLAPTPTRRWRMHSQQGSSLLEALVAILIFSIGILAIVGLQAASIRASADARYRTVAGQLADQVIGQMWASDRTISAMQTSFAGDDGSGGTQYLAFVTRVETALPVPSGAAYKPEIAVAPDGRVTVTIRWQPPGDAAATVNSHVVEAYVI